MIDVFPIVIQNQAALKQAYIKAKDKRKEAFDILIKRFIVSIECIQPKVIIVTNAFVKDLIRFIPDENNKNKIDIRIKSITVTPDSEKVCYYLTTPSGFNTTVFCGGMIAGGHQMDTESKQRLVRDVRNYLQPRRVK